ncbi:AraC family transcriptional regulator [Nocardia sp. NBC_00403]|uniref:AraC family transcriptional regulator n=1 Tax=Nocardia sp. NBC_00403 TaxID=2975990 RepID=UPI002E234712
MKPDYWREKDSPADSETNSDRREHWRDYLLRRQSAEFRLAFSDNDSKSEFGWGTVAQAVGNQQIVHFWSKPVHYGRTPEDAKVDGDDGFRLMVLVGGEFQLRQGDKADIFGPGEPALIRWFEDVEMRQYVPVDAVIMTVPRHLINYDLADDAPLALDTSHPLVPMLVSQIGQLHANHGKWTSDAFSVAYQSTLFLLNGVLGETGVVAQQGHAYVAAKARAKMETLVDDLRLTPNAVAQMCGVSPRTLHNALKHTEDITPGELLRKIRLDRAHDRLGDPKDFPIKKIAAAAGYSDSRRFAEAFRRQFGKTPREVREQRHG